MKKGRIVVITGPPGTGKTTTSAIIAKESGMETMWEQFHNLGMFEQNVINTTDCSIEDTVFAIKEKIIEKTALLRQ